MKVLVGMTVALVAGFCIGLLATERPATPPPGPDYTRQCMLDSEGSGLWCGFGPMVWHPIKAQ